MKITIPEFFDLPIEEITSILPTEGSHVKFDMQSSNDSDHKSIVGDLKTTIEKLESIENIRNGAKVGFEVQTSKLTSFSDKARKAQYLAEQISEQQVEYEDLKESYLIWIFINPLLNLEDEIIFTDLGFTKVRGLIGKDGMKFEMVDKDKYQTTFGKEEFLDLRKDSLMHEVEIYISDRNTDNVDLFQFLRELALNSHDRNEAIQTFSEFGWNLNKEEENLMEEVMSFSDIFYANQEKRIREEISEEFAQEYKKREEEFALRDKKREEEFALKEKQLKEYEQKLKEMELKLKNQK